MDKTACDYATYYIGKIFRHSASYIDKKLAPYNLSSGIFLPLLKVHFQPGVSQQFLSNMLIQDKGSIARAVKKLINLGFIRREKSDDDQRVYMLYTTAEGENLVLLVIEIIEEWNNMMTQGFNDGEVELAKRLLAKMLHNILNQENRGETNV